MSTENPARSTGLEVAKGVASCFALNLLHLGLAWLLLFSSGSYMEFPFKAGVVLTGGFGLLQLLYVVPLVLALRKRGRRAFAQGVIIGASLGFLLSAFCWGAIAISS